MFIVYKTTNKITGQWYIGVHGQETEKFDGYLGSGHWSSEKSKNRIKNLLPNKMSLQEAIETYGKDSFKRETLFSFDDKISAYIKESELVTRDVIRSEESYNLSIGGKHPGPSVMSEESNKKRSETLKKFYETNTHWQKGKPAWSKGRILSEDLVLKNSLSHMGQKAWNKGLKLDYSPRNNKIYDCPCCGRSITGASNLQRHLGKCKHKQEFKAA